MLFKIKYWIIAFEEILSCFNNPKSSNLQSKQWPQPIRFLCILSISTYKFRSIQSIVWYSIWLLWVFLLSVCFYCAEIGKNPTANKTITKFFVCLFELKFIRILKNDCTLHVCPTWCIWSVSPQNVSNEWREKNKPKKRQFCWWNDKLNHFFFHMLPVP